MSKKNKLAPFILILLLAALLFIIRTCRKETPVSRQQDNSAGTERATRGLNRNPVSIKYSKHARCRMSCRDITEAEVLKVLRNGAVNYRKSDLKGEECDKKYAVEDYANRQHLRIIFAPCHNTITVVTCIDLDKEWDCDCPGDKEP